MESWCDVVGSDVSSVWSIDVTVDALVWSVGSELPVSSCGCSLRLVIGMASCGLGVGSWTVVIVGSLACVAGYGWAVHVDRT